MSKNDFNNFERIFKWGGEGVIGSQLRAYEIRRRICITATNLSKCCRCCCCSQRLSKTVCEKNLKKIADSFQNGFSFVVLRFICVKWQLRLQRDRFMCDVCTTVHAIIKAADMHSYSSFWPSKKDTKFLFFYFLCSNNNNNNENGGQKSDE